MRLFCARSFSLLGFFAIMLLVVIRIEDLFHLVDSDCNHIEPIYDYFVFFMAVALLLISICNGCGAALNVHVNVNLNGKRIQLKMRFAQV